MHMPPPQTPSHAGQTSEMPRRFRALVLLFACCLQLTAGANAWADEPVGPPVAEPNLPPPPEGPPAAEPVPAADPAPAPAPAPAPSYSPASGLSPEQAAVQDAEADTSGVLWFGAGCLLSWIGVLVAYIASPTPPYSRLAGKPPEYASRYAMSYEQAGRGEQTRLALYGCGTTLVAYAVIMAYALSTPSSSL